MEIVYFSFIVFLFMLAVFDLVVGVSNDAVNFLNSAIGAKVARFRTILIIASIGVFVGATMSNGMMDIARHGIFQRLALYFPGSHGDGCGIAGCLQHVGDAYVYHRLYGF